MMKEYRFSAMTVGFYPTEMLDLYEQAGTLPDDLVAVSRADYETFTCLPPEGKMRGSQGGQPAWVDIPPIPQERLLQSLAAKKGLLLITAHEVMKPLEIAVRRGMATDEEKARLAAWEEYSVMVSRVDINGSSDVVWPTAPEGEF